MLHELTKLYTVIVSLYTAAGRHSVSKCPRVPSRIVTRCSPAPAPADADAAEEEEEEAAAEEEEEEEDDVFDFFFPFRDGAFRRMVDVLDVSAIRGRVFNFECMRPKQNKYIRLVGSTSP